jgi:hypothetical protein
MEPGRRYASEHGKLCGALNSVGVKGVYIDNLNLCYYHAQISNEKLPVHCSDLEMVKNKMVFNFNCFFYYRYDNCSKS